MTTTLAHPARDEIRIAAVPHAPADPVRLRIVGALAERGHGVARGVPDPGLIDGLPAAVR